MPGLDAARPLGPIQWRPSQMPLIMGIINVTPDSFSDGGQFIAADAALAHARQLAEQGAHILDIGGESTRPDATPVNESEELARVLPAIRAIIEQDLGCALSIDTYKANVAAKALEAGVHIVNDVWGLQRDPDIAKAAADHQAPVIINHWETEKQAGLGLIDQMKAFFDRSIAIAQAAGLSEDRIILDPGIGFGKDLDDNLVILNGLETLIGWGYPLLIGTSRKRFIGALTGREAQDRVHGTVASNVLALEKGASIFRVHDVAAHKDALAVAGAILNPQGS
ncbi:dihydropteroate synthase [Cohaesibacter sp. CAU 1516]|uniref:dihydropteroate synthase n=1 Tax=Cohaesibacter sp. CAU 1516 TaxID=2576038 RepID=UPI0010FCE29A|nr:dihydropteroate synthase [Cohaesibacter sp. CAU 1516]TLP48806.1 dihydropteroate synthase [Cohaesibacter sp. CAU 1516]